MKQPAASPARIRQLWLMHEPRKIAAMLRISTDEVLDVPEWPTQARVAVTLWCNRSDRVWNVRSWRAPYMRVCLYGLTDWGWCRKEVYEAWAAAQGRS